MIFLPLGLFVFFAVAVRGNDSEPVSVCSAKMIQNASIDESVGIMWSVDSSAAALDGSPFAELLIQSARDEPLTVNAGFEFSYEDFRNAGFEEKEPSVIQELWAEMTVFAISTTHSINATSGLLNLNAGHGEKVLMLASLTPSLLPSRKGTLKTDQASFQMIRGAPTVVQNFSFLVTFSIGPMESGPAVMPEPQVRISVDSVCLQVIVRQPGLSSDPTTNNPIPIPTTTTSASTMWSTAWNRTTTGTTTATTTTAATTRTNSTTVGVVRPPFSTSKQKPAGTVGMIDPPQDGLETLVRTGFVTIGRDDDDTITHTLSSSIQDTYTSTSSSTVTVLTPTTTVATLAGGNELLSDTPAVDSGLSALDMIGVGGFVGIGIGACLLFGALAAIVFVCAKRKKEPSQTEQVSSSEMQSARSQRVNDNDKEVASVVNDEYVAPPKFTLHDEYHVGELNTQV